MGQFSAVVMTAVFDNAKTAKQAQKQVENNFTKYLKKKLVEKDFDVNITKAESDGVILEIELDSGRAQNAQWQAEQVFEMLKDLYGANLDEFTAEQVIPENIIYYNKEDEQE